MRRSWYFLLLIFLCCGRAREIDGFMQADRPRLKAGYSLP
jgi:hypothetical protein